ncbi:diguanylate cyclase domain-containing protein [Cohnella sp. GCM10027633]|uniref:diguanylate cyclase domain-containing protein n=1 Tax=unclassified Cohnella TaxID=2636738 RepID=UPI00363584F9
MIRLPRARTARVKFHLVLSGLLAVSLLGSSAILIGAAMNKQNRTLTDTTLQSNFEGARNLNISINALKDVMFRELGSTARFLGEQAGADGPSPEWAVMLLGGAGLFNQAVLVDGSGNVRAFSGPGGNAPGPSIAEEAMRRALRSPEPLFSEPFQSPNGHRTILVSFPFGPRGQPPRGFFGGLIDLETRNVFSELFEHAIKSRKGTFAYIVDPTGAPLLIPDESRRDELVPAEVIRETFAGGELRHLALEDASGRTELVGYIRHPDLGWGVAFQSPAARVDEAMREMLRTQLVWIVPFIAALLLFSLWTARKLAAPFAALTAMARRAERGERIGEAPFEKHWNYEAHHLAIAVSNAMRGLQNETERMTEQALTDSLTGLANRAGLDRWLGEEDRAKEGYALLVIDIDHFKRVNDIHGHQLGDETLKLLADALRLQADSEALLCRVGGEEFIALLPATDERAARDWGERVRKRMETTVGPIGQPITVSIGAACCPANGNGYDVTFAQADRALYEAKRAGRNRTVVAGDDARAV